jgi:predicted lipoprotein with Yx(FWY)xxD motif
MNRSLIGAALIAMAASAAMAAPDERAAPVRVQKTIYGEAFTDNKGMTLYYRTAKDECVGSCLKEWKPIRAAEVARPVGDWTIVVRPDDGGRQWAWQGKPVYTSTRDHEAGDVAGDGAPGWETAIPKRNYVPSDVVVRPTEFGATWARASDGRTLYMKMIFVNSNDGVTRHLGIKPGPEACTDECLNTFIPLAASEGAKEEGDWKIVTRPDGSKQWAWKDMALYLYAKDTKPGDILGEGGWVVGEKTTVTYWEVASLTP